MSIEGREQQPMPQMAQMMPNNHFLYSRGFSYPNQEYQNFNNMPQNYPYSNIPGMGNYTPPPEYCPTDNQDIHEEIQDRNTNQNPKASNSEKQKPKLYVNLLYNSIEQMFKDGRVTMPYLNEKTEPKMNGVSGSDCSSINSNQSICSSSKEKILKSAQIGQCENKFCQSTFTSVKDRIKVKIKGLITQEKKLCKKCNDSVEKGKFCFYCNSIYRDDIIDNDKWVQCDKCKKWEHFDCEIAKGKRYTNLQLSDENNQYLCPICYRKIKEQKNLSDKAKKKLLNNKRAGDSFEEQKSKKPQKKNLRDFKSENSELIEDLQLMGLLNIFE